MTFEEACKALGYEQPLDWMDELSRGSVIETAEELSGSGKRPIVPAMAELARAQIEMMG